MALALVVFGAIECPPPQFDLPEEQSSRRIPLTLKSPKENELYLKTSGFCSKSSDFYLGMSKYPSEKAKFSSL